MDNQGCLNSGPIKTYTSQEKQYGAWSVSTYEIINKVVPFTLVVYFCSDGEHIQKIGDVHPSQTITVELEVVPGMSALFVKDKQGTTIGDPVYLMPTRNRVYLSTIAFDDNQPWDASFVNLHADMPSVRFHNYLPFDLQFRYAPAGKLGVGSTRGEVIGKVASGQDVWFSNDWQGLNVSDQFMFEMKDGTRFATIVIPSCYVRDIYIGQNISS
jgi:hypothetical protein